MKINWKKILNPNNIDFKAMENMSKEELNDYTKEIYTSEWAKVYVRYTWLFNYLCTTNVWQYVLVLWTR